ncbi:hypothetical protein HELRODRAFT_192431 [Helobdella robusta]|uniref:Phospholipid/glycerol acyltransferase domain-containing protein n=1 Tax=Helobdella robusta TaxID=6412 RepID=T1FTY5_HELRO|nr:hypothetical protein HELRODRAFT_192431 [Helobdella robusta]ESO00822.1 hypothetical protein HELRODRAFT_192431 [Helobdella robusta]
MNKRHIFLRIIFVVVNNLYAIPAYLMWILLIRPLKYISLPLYDSLEGTLYGWLLEMVAFWIWSANVIVSEVGDNLNDCLNDNCLVMCNHQSTSDVPVLMYYMTSKPDLPNKLSWIMDIMFKYTNFGWVSQVHHDFFIKQGKSTRAAQLTQLKEYLLNIYLKYDRRWLILFPEGGFLYKRKESSQKYAQKFGYHHLDYCTLPRTGALHTIINTLASEKAVEVANGNTTTSITTSSQRQHQGRTNVSSPSSEGPTHNLKTSNDTLSFSNLTTSPVPQKQTIQEQTAAVATTSTKNLKYLIDLTILYPSDNAPSAFSLICRRRLATNPLHIIIACRKFSIGKISQMSAEQFQTWIFNRWLEKDNMLKEFYSTGKVHLKEYDEDDGGEVFEDDAKNDDHENDEYVQAVSTYYTDHVSGGRVSEHFARSANNNGKIGGGLDAKSYDGGDAAGSASKSSSGDGSKEDDVSREDDVSKDDVTKDDNNTSTHSNNNDDDDDDDVDETLNKLNDNSCKDDKKVLADFGDVVNRSAATATPTTTTPPTTTPPTTTPPTPTTTDSSSAPPTSKCNTNHHQHNDDDKNDSSDNEDNYGDINNEFIRSVRRTMLEPLDDPLANHSLPIRDGNSGMRRVELNIFHESKLIKLFQKSSIRGRKFFEDGRRACLMTSASQRFFARASIIFSWMPCEQAVNLYISD